MDLVEPWVIRSAVVVGLLAGVNAWLFLLSTKLATDVADASSNLAKNVTPCDQERSPGIAPS